MREKPARGLFRAEWRRACRSWIWFAVPLLIFGIMALEILSDFPDAQTRRQYIMSNVGYYCFGINFGSIVIALPFLAGFVHAPTAADDWNSGLAVYILRRTSAWRYALAKYAACTLSAAAAICLGFVLYAIYTSILYLPSDIARYPRQVLPLEDSTLYGNLYGHHGGIAFFLVHFFQMALYGAVWSGVGAVCAVLFRQRFAAPLSSMIVYHVAMYATQVLGWRWLDPAAMIVYFDNNVDFTIWNIVLVQGAALLLLGILFVGLTARRARNG